MVESEQWSAPHIEQALEIARGELPREFESWDEVPGWMGKTRPEERVADGISWGVYEAAIRRWEEILGRAAPTPTDEKGRLAPEFVEWMLGFPAGWTAGAARTARLRMLGNSVQVQVGVRVGLALLALDEALACA
jgi:DNA (cytosine-5)-methyltransferase 1